MKIGQLAEKAEHQRTRLLGLIVADFGTPESLVFGKPNFHRKLGYGADQNSPVCRSTNCLGFEVPAK